MHFYLRQPIDPFRIMLAAHEFSLSDSFVTEVFVHYEMFCKHKMFGNNQFSSQQQVQEISTPYFKSSKPSCPSIGGRR